MLYQLQLLADYIAVKLNREEGATMVEYGLLIALIAIVVAVAATTLGTGVSSLFVKANSKLT